MILRFAAHGVKVSAVMLAMVLHLLNQSFQGNYKCCLLSGRHICASIQLQLVATRLLFTAVMAALRQGIAGNLREMLQGFLHVVPPCAFSNVLLLLLPCYFLLKPFVSIYLSLMIMFV
jgi:hypothetical protein